MHRDFEWGRKNWAFPENQKKITLISPECEPRMSIQAFPLKCIGQSQFSPQFLHGSWALEAIWVVLIIFCLAYEAFPFSYTPIYKWGEKRPLLFSCTIWIIIFLRSPMNGSWVKQLHQGTFESFTLEEKWHTEQISQVRPKLLFCVRFTGSPGHLSAFL